MGWELLYRCRVCSKLVYVGCAFADLHQALIKAADNYEGSATQAPKFYLHRCFDDRGFGIADLVGAEEVRS